MALSLTITIFMGILLLRLPRRLAIVPFVITTLYLSSVVVMIGSLDFNMVRVILVFGWIRIISKKEISLLKLNKIDKVVILWVLISIINYTLLYKTTGAFINRLGQAYDIIGSYFLLRILIQDIDDIDFLFKAIAIIIIPMTIEMLFEHKTGKNLFSLLGGIPEISEVRNGSVRCRGSFRYHILSGTFGGSILPIMVSLWFRNLKLISIIGLICCTIITLTSTSSGAVMAYIFSLTALLLWRYRANMRVVRYGIIFLLISLNLLMDAPIYYLPARIAEIIGGSGWYRSYLIGAAIHHINEWWLIGTSNTSHWIGGYVLSNNPDMTDITSQYVGEGVTGGLFKLLLFVMIIVLCFINLGKALREIKTEHFSKQMTIWAIGAMLFSHTMSFWVIYYQDQIKIFYYLIIAIISSLNIYKLSSKQFDSNI